MTGNAWRVLFIFFVVLALIFFLVFSRNAAPMVNDITTTPADPPRYHYVAEDPEYQTWMAEQQVAAYPDIVPHKRAIPVEKLFQNVQLLALEQADWEIIKIDPKTYSVEAVATTSLLRFKDDVIIQVRPDGEGSAVHMRSRSRVGKGDMGANAARIRAFFKELDEKYP